MFECDLTHWRSPAARAARCQVQRLVRTPSVNTRPANASRFSGEPVRAPLTLRLRMEGAPTHAQPARLLQPLVIPPLSRRVLA